MNTKRYKVLLLVLLGLILLAGGFSLWQVQRNAPEPKTAESVEENPMVIGQNVSFTVTEGEVKKWVLEAETAIYNEDQSSAKLKNIRGRFFNSQGEPVLEFSAPEGQYTNRNNAVVLTGGVTAKTVTQGEGEEAAMDKSELTAPRMIWNAKSERVLADGGIMVDYGRMGKSTAQRARFTLDFSSMSLEGNVRSEVLY